MPETAEEPRTVFLPTCSEKAYQPGNQRVFNPRDFAIRPFDRQISHYATDSCPKINNIRVRSVPDELSDDPQGLRVGEE